MTTPPQGRNEDGRDNTEIVSGRAPGNTAARTGTGPAGEGPDARPARRPEPSTLAGEREMLEGWLEYHRETLAMKCAGLTEAQLRQHPVAPSGLSLMGLVRHLAECERGWFRNTLAGEDLGGIWFTDEDVDGDFHPGPDDTWADAHGTWQAEIALARERAEGRSLDDTGLGRRHRVTGEPYNLRWIYTHMIEEYARHNGHADLLREAIDGATGD